MLLRFLAIKSNTFFIEDIFKIFVVTFLSCDVFFTHNRVQGLYKKYLGFLWYEHDPRVFLHPPTSAFYKWGSSSLCTFLFVIFFTPCPFLFLYFLNLYVQTLLLFFQQVRALLFIL